MLGGKRLSIITVLLIAVVTSAKSQENEKPFNFGVVTGINFSYFNTRIGEFGADDDYESFVRISPVIGAEFRYQLDKLFAVRSALLFNLRGGSYRTESGIAHIGGNGDDKSYYMKNYRLNYIEIPALGELRILNLQHWSHPFDVKLVGGFSVGVPVASSLRYNGFAPTGTTAGPLEEVEEEYHTVQIGHANSPIVNAIGELSFDFVNGHDTKLFIRIGVSSTMTKVYNRDQIDDENFFTGMTTWSITAGRYFFK